MGLRNVFEQHNAYLGIPREWRWQLYAIHLSAHYALTAVQCSP